MQKTLLGGLVVVVLAFIVLQVTQTKPVVIRSIPQTGAETSVNTANSAVKTHKPKIEITPESAAASAISSLSAKGELNLDTSKVKDEDPAEDAAVFAPEATQ